MSATTTAGETAGIEGIPLVDLPDAAARTTPPGFDGATAWLNVDHPLTLQALRGRVVVVDFWTSCCINCLHTLPTLARIEERFAGQPVVVVGVHSPKFEEERGAERLVDQIHQLGVHHPVAVDGEMAIWDRWGAQSWPTVLVLDSEGRAVWVGGGEPEYAQLASVVASALAEGRAAGTLAKRPLQGLRVEPPAAATPLRYPGKVTALADGGIAIADTAHHRVVLLDASGAVASVVGAGQAGFADGDFASARFRWPQGMAELGGDLYVADTNNHVVRKIDRKARVVTTVAGTGVLGERYLGEEPVEARSFGLRSPWDLLAFEGDLVVALAGSHQIGRYSPERGHIRRMAGNGIEDIVDGTTTSASFAQPSALATDGAEIFVLDSETSSVRAIDPRSERVRTVVGKGLFVFGDVDGDRDRTRLQHPIGMTWGDGALWVADTYNSKLKRIDPRTGASKSWLGDASGSLAEPAGLAFMNGALLVADTNHHRILRVPLTSPPVATPIALAGLQPPRPAGERIVKIDPADPIARLGTLEIEPGKASRVFVGFATPPGTKVNAEGPARVTWIEADGLPSPPAPLRAHGADVQGGFEITLEPSSKPTTGRLRGVLELVLCDALEGRVCLPVRRTLEADLVVRDGAVPRAEPVLLPKAE